MTTQDLARVPGPVPGGRRRFAGAGQLPGRRRDRYPDQVSKPKKSQVMKPSTAAEKLDVYLPAMPREFQERLISREELDELQRNPPQWLVDLRRNGPHPRNVVAARLRISNSGLARGGITEPLTTAQIAALVADPPEWLARERETHAEVLREQRRLRERREGTGGATA
ncbi:DUF5997 family protein [Rugosimonospora africana]|uniref:Uncharacterized protein n=1 Tax=Rugosimonospora africana TaxID=556532 RepID=A0A8J3VQA4_9ACTN|nr:DUF5997 family protein [Rugosimonospora africana]GIH14246.1 hypothetical protein Raf01_24180 [Rugosimonospora africana]